jgi:predicted PurR-regulated permease PerM
MNVALQHRHQRSLFIAFVAVLAVGILIALAAFLPGPEDTAAIPTATRTAQEGERARAVEAAPDQSSGMMAAMLLVAALTGGGIGMALWLARRLDLEW